MGVKTTEVPEAMGVDVWVKQANPQLMPPVELITVPPAAIFLFRVRVVVAMAAVKLAVTVLLTFMVTLQIFPATLVQPVQLEKV